MIDNDDPSVSERKRALLVKLQTEGLEEAYATALAICRDPKAPAPAKATALTSLFRAGGAFNRQEDVDAKPLHEMDGHELHAATLRVLKTLKAAQSAEREEREDITAPAHSAFD